MNSLPILPVRDNLDPADPLTIARDAGVCDALSLLANVERIRTRYLAATGDELSYALAIHCMDQLQSEQRAAKTKANRTRKASDSAVIPERLLPLSHWMFAHGYSPEMIHLAICEVMATGHATGSMAIESEDWSYTQEILDRINGIEVAV